MNITDILYDFINNFSFLILSAVGLAIIFGMMKIINLAHGEFIMLGAYITTIATNAGIPLVVSMILSVIGVGVFGFVVDRLIISKLYGRELDSIVVTWGISLILQQGIMILFGPSLQSVSTPLGSVSINGNDYSIYRILLFLISLSVLVLLYFVFMKTKFGLHSRATMQNPNIAQCMGINTNWEYSMTFSLGSALAGFAGALYAPTMTISPTFGAAFLMPAFVTVIVGGANPLIGQLFSGSILGIVNTALDSIWGAIFGLLGLLTMAIIVIRILPLGISGVIEKLSIQRHKG